MYAGERLVANDGYEVALFPMPYLRMSQDEGGDFSHQGTYNIDLLGWSASGRVYDAPIYAPCSCHVVYRENSYNSGNIRVFQSNNMVHTPAGLQYIHFYFCHDENPPASSVGQSFTQGDLISHTGTYGQVTGDHTHTCMGYGQWVSWSHNITTRSTGHQDLTYRLHYWDAVYVNDTIISQGYGHNWQTWTEPIPPPVPTYDSKFPWYIYNRKRRNLWK